MNLEGTHLRRKKRLGSVFEKVLLEFERSFFIHQIILTHMTEEPQKQTDDTIVPPPETEEPKEPLPSL